MSLLIVSADRCFRCFLNSRTHAFVFVWFVDGLVAANMVSLTVYGVIIGVLKLQLVGTDGCARAGQTSTADAAFRKSVNMTREINYLPKLILHAVRKMN